MATRTPHGSGTPCPFCRGTNTKKNGTNTSADGRSIPRRLCHDCDAEFDSQTINSADRCECGLLRAECDGHTNWLGTADEILRSPRLNTPYAFNLNHFAK